MSDNSTKRRQRVSRKGEETPEGNFRIGVNGRPIEFDHKTGEVVSGPTVMRGKFIPPSQVQELVSTQHDNGWYGHLNLADSKEGIPVAEAEIEILRLAAVKSEHIREGMLFNYNGLNNWRIEDIDHTRGVAICSQESSPVRPISLTKLVRDAEFLPEATEKLEKETGVAIEKLLEGEEKIVYDVGQKVMVDVQLNDPQNTGNTWVPAKVVAYHPDQEGEAWDEDDYDIEFENGIPDEIANHIGTEGNIFRAAPESWLHSAEGQATNDKDSDDDKKLLEAMTDEELLEKVQNILEFISQRKAATK